MPTFALLICKQKEFRGSVYHDIYRAPRFFSDEPVPCQIKQQETLWRKQSHRLTEIVRNNEGVWLSAKVFYIVGSLFLLPIITIALEIAFYVYFHWIL